MDKIPRNANLLLVTSYFSSAPFSIFFVISQYLKYFKRRQATIPIYFIRAPSSWFYLLPSTCWYIRRPLGHPGWGIALLESTKNQQTIFQHPSTFKNPISLQAAEVSIWCFDVSIFGSSNVVFRILEYPSKMFIGGFRASPLAKNRRDLPLPPVISHLGLQPNPGILENSFLGAYVGSSWRSWSPFYRQHDAALPQNRPRQPILEPISPS